MLARGLTLSARVTRHQIITAAQRITSLSAHLQQFRTASSSSSMSPSIPSKMRAAQILEQSEDVNVIEVREVQVPQAGPGQVLYKVRGEQAGTAAPLSGTGQDAALYDTP